MLRRPPKRYAGEQPLNGEEMRRRADVVRLATNAHETTGDALTFLNDHNAELGGRPLDLATKSDAGLAAVEAALKS